VKRLISILLPNLVGGGVERVRIVLAHELARAGTDVEFVLMQARGQLLEEVQASFSVVDLKSLRARNLPRSLFRYLRHRRPDALLVAMWPLTAIAPLAARLSGHRGTGVMCEHNTLSVQYGHWGRLHRLFLRTSMALGYRLADSRIGVSAGVVRDIAALSCVRPDSFEVVHNPLPPRAEPPPEAFERAEKLWAGPRGHRVVTIGSMKAQKNHPLLMKAFKKVDHEDARLMFVGDGKGRDTLIALARELCIAERVIVAGFHADPTPLYNTADVFVLSSDYEGFGNVIIEALASGTPVVSTDCPSGPAEILEQGRYGQLVPVGNADALASAITQTLESPAEPARLKARASEFDPAVAARAYLNLLRV